MVVPALVGLSTGDVGTGEQTTHGQARPQGEGAAVHEAKPFVSAQLSTTPPYWMCAHPWHNGVEVGPLPEVAQCVQWLPALLACLLVDGGHLQQNSNTSTRSQQQQQQQQSSQFVLLMHAMATHVAGCVCM